MTDFPLLASLRSHRDHALGISERFETVCLRSGWTIGVVSTPLEPPARVGWLVCHSFGAEQWHLNATDVAIARTLSSRGFPVLRFQCQGYGDSERIDAVPSVRSHLDDTKDAVEHLRSIEGVETVGLIGARFGAAVAFTVAAEIAAPFVALVDPVVTGSGFIRNLLRSRAIAELTPDASGERTDQVEQGDPRSVLRSGGVVSVRGFEIRPEVYLQMVDVDLMKIQGFRGEALTIRVSRSDRPEPRLVRLGRHIEEAGGRVTSELVSGQHAALFGEGHFRPVEGDELGDALVGVNDQIARAVADWGAATTLSAPSEEAS